MTAGKRPRLMMRRTVSVASLGAGSDSEHHVPHQVIGFAVKAFSENSSTSMQVSVEEPVSCSSSPSSPASKPKPFSGLTLLSDSTNREMMPPTSPSSGLGILAALNNTNPGSGGSVTRSCVVAANCQPHSRKQKHKAVLEAEEATNFQSNFKYDRCILRPSFTTLGFLESCHLCKRDISHGRDIYMYRGDKAFCSAECRHQQILNDERMERREKCSSAALKQGTQQGRHQRSKVSATTPATKVSAAA